MIEGLILKMVAEYTTKAEAYTNIMESAESFYDKTTALNKAKEYNAKAAGLLELYKRIEEEREEIMDNETF